MQPESLIQQPDCQMRRYKYSNYLNRSDIKFLQSNTKSCSHLSQLEDWYKFVGPCPATKNHLANLRRKLSRKYQHPRSGAGIRMCGQYLLDMSRLLHSISCARRSLGKGRRSICKCLVLGLPRRQPHAVET